MAHQLSRRPSLIAAAHESGDAATALKDEEDELMECKTGDVVSGFVVGVSRAGCFIRVTRRITARAAVKNLSDE